MNKHRHRLLCCAAVMFAAVSGLQRNVAAAPQSAAVAAPSASSWSLTPVAQTVSGGSGFLSLGDGAVGASGRVAVRALHSSMGQGVFTISAGQVISVALIGSALPGGLGAVQALGNADSLAVDATGGVWFIAQTSVLPQPSVYRWTQSGVTLVRAGDANKQQLLSSLQPNGTWIAQELQNTQVAGNFVLTYSIASTSGYQPVYTAPLLQQPVEPACRKEVYSSPSLSANGTLVFNRLVIDGVVLQGGGCAQSTSEVYSVLARGTVSKTVASATLSHAGSSPSGASIGAPVINESGNIAMHRSEYSGVSGSAIDKIVINNGVGDTIVLSSGEADFNLGAVRHIDSADRVVFVGLLPTQPNSTPVILAGPNLTADRVAVAGDSIGSNVSLNTNLDIVDVASPPTGLSDQRVILFRYSFSANGNSGLSGFAVATRSVSRWINPSGGTWGTPEHWLPAEVPGATAETVFDLEANYDVNVGIRTSGRSRVENGTVGFRIADLKLTGPLTIGGDATLTLPEGRIVSSDLTIGSLPPINPAQPVVAKLTVSNPGTAITTTGKLLIGNAGDGELFNSGGLMNSGEVRIGSGSIGTATVGGLGSEWTTIGSVAVGDGYTGTLNVERGAEVFAGGQLVIGAGGTLQNRLAAVRIDNGGIAQPALQQNLIVAETLTIGDNLRGLLDITNGGTVLASGNAHLGDKAHGVTGRLDAEVSVSGTGATKEEPSAFDITGDLSAGLVNGATVDVSVRNGGLLTVDGTLSLGQAAGSQSLVSISGLNANGARSKMRVGTQTGGDCLIGIAGRGSLDVKNRAEFECVNTMKVGAGAGGTGSVLVIGQTGDATPLFKAKKLCIGASTACGIPTGASGVFEMRDDAVVHIAGEVIVGRAGRLSADGVLTATIVSVESGGFIEFGLTPLASASQLRSTRDATAAQPGTLTLNGNLSLSASAVITIDVTSATDFDKLIVTGNSALNGKLVLNFSNGYAPKQGDSFKFLSSPNSSGAFANVEIAGLAPGFQYAVTTSGGGTQLVANNNGVATTVREPLRVLLPLVRR